MVLVVIKHSSGLERVTDDAVIIEGAKLINIEQLVFKLRNCIK